MTIQDHIGLLQAIHRGIPGVNFAPDRYPDTLPSVPAILTVPRAGTHDDGEHLGRTYLYTDRTYETTLFYQQETAGIFGANLEGINELAEAVLDAYHRTAKAGFAGVDGDYPYILLDDENPISDEGLSEVAFSGADYSGWVFSLRIRDVRETT